MNKKVISRCPFNRQGTASRKLYLALARAKTPLLPHEVARLAKIPLAQASTLLRAYRNPIHAIPLTRKGITLRLKNRRFWLSLSKPRPNARRRRKEKKGRSPIKTQKKRRAHQPSVNGTPPAAVESAATGSNETGVVSK